MTFSKTDRRFVTGAARAAGGAIIFALPLFMTFEMWQVGAHVAPYRVVVLLCAGLPLLVFLSAYSGFERTTRIFHDVVDAFVAIAIAIFASALCLGLMAILSRDLSLEAWMGKLAIQIVPASMGALLAQSQLGAKDETDGGSGGEIDHDNPGYAAELALMAAGALFLGLNVAPTHEVLLLASRMTAVHMLLLVLFSVVAMHGFVYAAEFRGHHAGKAPAWSAFARFSVPGYVVALAVSAFVLWTFGRFDGNTPGQWLRLSVVLGFPSAIGAAAARLVL